MFIFQRPSDSIQASILDNIKSLPQSVKDWYKKQPHGSPSLPADENGLVSVKFTEYLCMKAADNSIVNGWLASQTDMLAEDWCLVN